MSVSKVVPLGRRGKLERKKYQSKKINSYYDIKAYAYSQPPPPPPPPLVYSDFQTAVFLF